MPDPSPELIRPATPADEPAIARVVTDAFGPSEGPVVARLVEALRASPAWDPALSFVAEDPSGQVIGYVLATVNLLDAPPRLVDVLVLSPLAVHPAHQHRGVGSRLVRHALAVLQDRPEPLVFLEGSPAYYPRFGFQPAGQKGFRRPSLRIPEPAFMVHPLPAYQPWMTGTLVYADPFWRLDCVGLRDPTG
ncbi:MAG TPA: N-acetyltransferase [Streptosporangiaceae bacterium]|nr:N-acetyltransferase [Streptosporangiaceae bacterium]